MSLNVYSKFPCDSSCFCDFFLSFFFFPANKYQLLQDYLPCVIHLFDSCFTSRSFLGEQSFCVTSCFFWVQGKSFCQSMHTPDIVANKVLLVFPLGSITYFWRISLYGLVWGAAADICLPWSVPHYDTHCIWEPLSYTVVKVIQFCSNGVSVSLYLFGSGTIFGRRKEWHLFYFTI